LTPETFKNFVLKLENNKLIESPLSTVIIGQMESGGISPRSNRAPNGVIYDWRNNKIYYDESFITTAIDNISTDIKNYLSKKILRKDEKSLLQRMLKEHIGKFFATILYNGIHAYNANQRGALITYESNDTFYRTFFNRLLFDYTKSSTISRLVVSLWYRRYLNIILEHFEIPMLQGITRINNNTIGRVNYLFTEIYKDTLEYLNQYDIDQPTLDIYRDWFGLFIKEFVICAKNQNHRLTTFNQDFLDQYNFKVLTYKSLDDAYRSISIVNVLESRYPVPIFRELFVTSEPMAQYIYALSLNNKLNVDTNIQNICARGISFLT